MTERQKDQLEPGAGASQNDPLFRAAAAGGEALPAPGARASENDPSTPATAADDAQDDMGDEACVHANGSAQRKRSFSDRLRDGVFAKILLGNKGNPPRLLRGGLTAMAGGLLAFTVMTAEAQLRFGILLGLVAVAVATFGI